MRVLRFFSFVFLRFGRTPAILAWSAIAVIWSACGLFAQTRSDFSAFSESELRAVYEKARQNLPKMRLIDKGEGGARFNAALDENAMVIQSSRKGAAELSAVDSSLRPFYHGVASGDPLHDRVILWTRVTPASDGVISVRWAVARDPEMKDTVVSGATTTASARDYTVKIDVAGLDADKTYYYAFSALGAHSLVGRTKTLPAPQADVRHVRLAIVSCSSYPHGFFNAYGRIADRNDLDAVVHLGDYIYEYDASETSYGGRTGIKINRVSSPANEIVSLADYRTRYSQYRLDSNLRRLHQQHPMIHVWDDHESANDSHKDGAQNHQAATEGRWDVRKAVSKRVAYEWLPTRENADTIIYRQFAFGSLVDLIMLDTRLEGRDPQIEGVLPSSPQSAKDSINAPNRTVLGEKQFEWFIDRLRSSQAAWRVIGNQVMFAPLRVDKVDIDRVRRYSFVLSLLAPTLMETLQEAFYGDVWTNYPAERKKIVDSIERHGIRNVVIATGDFHTSFAMDVTLNAADPSRYDAATGRGAVAVEFMCPSVSSANFDENIPGALSSVINGVMRTLGFPSPQRESFAEQMALRDTRELLGVLDDALKEQNRHLKYHNLTEHGYTLLDLKPERAQGDYWFVDTILTPSRRERFAAGFFTQNGQNNLQRASAPASPKAAQALPAPARPLRVTLVSDVPPLAEEAAKDVEFGGGLTLLGFFPNPAEASAAGYAHYTLKAASLVTVEILDAMGNIVLTPVRNQLQSGHVTALFDLSALPAGAYTCRICTASETRARVCYSPLSAEGCFLSGDKTAFRLSAS